MERFSKKFNVYTASILIGIIGSTIVLILLNLNEIGMFFSSGQWTLIYLIIPFIIPAICCFLGIVRSKINKEENSIREKLRETLLAVEASMKHIKELDAMREVKDTLGIQLKDSSGL